MGSFLVDLIESNSGPSLGGALRGPLGEGAPTSLLALWTLSSLLARVCGAAEPELLYIKFTRKEQTLRFAELLLVKSGLLRFLYDFIKILLGN